MSETAQDVIGALRLYQCPGCFSHTLVEVPGPDQYMECDCGEALTLIDLRDERGGAS